MIVYRIVRYECSDATQLEAHLKLTVKGSWEPTRGLRITATALDPKQVEQDSFIMNRLREASVRAHVPVREAKTPSPRTNASGFLPLPASDPSEVLDFLREIDALMDSGDYDYADETLAGIRGTVERTERVTEAQRTAVSNVADKPSRGGR